MDRNIPIQPTQPVTPEVQVSQPQPEVIKVPSNSRNPLKYILIALVILIIIVISGGAYVLNNNSVKKVLPSPTPMATINSTATPSPTAVINEGSAPSPTPTTIAINSPKYMAFMKNGQIWFNDFLTNNQTVKVSKSNAVNSPKLSRDGKYVIYYSIVHATGGFPLTNIFLADTKGTSEINLGTSNDYASRLTWSKKEDYVGFILFSDNKQGTAVLYDALLQKTIFKYPIIIVKTDMPENQK